MDRDVVITGIGVLSPIGIGRDGYWKGLFQGTTGFKEITLFDAAPFHVRLGGEISNFDPLTFLGKKGLRELDRSTRLLCSAARLAIDDGKLELIDTSAYSTGVSIGATFGSLHSIVQFDRSRLLEGPKAVNPSLFPNTVINSPASHVSIRFGIKGFNTTISTGFCASLDAVIYAADFIRLNRAKVVLAGGVEELCEETFFGFHKLGCLSGLDGSEAVCRPFDAKRNGVILSEGAAIVILENERHAINRNAAVYAHVMGYGNVFDPAADWNFKHPGQGLKNAIAYALKEAALVPEKIDYICSCSNSTIGLDRMESKVIKDIFGRRTPVSSIKSMVGESLSASGMMALVAAIGAIQNGRIPPTMNYSNADPDCDLDYVPNQSRPGDIRTVLVTSTDPFGQNTAVIIGK
jgi:3-oxoacyl-[acyl-carrier-protein] synthase II